MPEERSVLGRAEDLSDWLTELRRDIHRHPELSGHETRTMGVVAAELRKLGIGCEEGVGRTGVVGLIEGARPGPCVGVRVDMDALPVQETTGLEFASESPGVMHACGHDVHTACGLGAAALLRDLRDRIRGSVKLIFQPSEEMVSGAQRMIEAGVLDNPPVATCLGFPGTATLDAPICAFSYGAKMAGTSTFEVRVIGSSGHAAQPHLTVDPIPIAAQIVLALQTIVSRRVAPTTPAVVSIGVIEGGRKANIVATDVRCEGTLRFFETELHDRLRDLVEQTALGIARTMGADAEVSFGQSTPPLVVDTAATDRVAAACRAELGPGRVSFVEDKTMGGEDFAFIAERVPSAHFWLGARTPGKADWPPLHSPSFTVDERCLPVGAAALAAGALALGKE